MKEETKKKLCKISKIVGFAITFGFAFFGALCAAMLIGNGSKKDDIKTLDNSLVQNEVRSERNIKPRKAEEDNNLFNHYADVIPNKYISGYGAGTITYSYDPNWRTYVWSQNEMPAGYYLLRGVRSGFNTVAGFFMGQSEVNDISNLASNSSLTISNDLWRYAFVEGGSDNEVKIYFNVKWENFDRFTLNCANQTSLTIELVDTLDVPAKDVVNFPSNWSPMALISDNLSIKGGYAFVDVSPASYQTLVPITISLKQNLFRYDGKVYDEMVFTFVDLSHGDGYIQDDGQPWKPWEKTTSQLSSSLHVFGLYSLRFNSSFSSESIVALSPIYSDSPFQTGGDGTYYPPTVYLPTGEYRWVNPKVTYIELIDTSFGSGSSRYDGRYVDYSDLALLTYLNGYSSEGNYLAIGGSGVFGLMEGAFNGLLPILSVQVLPNITLGILLFLPLIGGIIVIIIRVVKK